MKVIVLLCGFFVGQRVVVAADCAVDTLALRPAGVAVRFDPHLGAADMDSIAGLFLAVVFGLDAPNTNFPALQLCEQLGVLTIGDWTGPAERLVVGALAEEAVWFSLPRRRRFTLRILDTLCLGSVRFVLPLALLGFVWSGAGKG